MIIDDKILKQNPLAEGGEGIIYEVGNQILKVYKNTVDIKEKEQKVKLLMTKNLPKNVIKPTDIALDKNNNFIGYIMDKVDGEEFKRLTNKKFLQINNVTTKDILKMLVDVKNVLTILHTQHIYISDLNDCNILFDKNYNVYFIDCDSWTIDNIKCTVCMDSFKDPLLKGNDFSDLTDAFAFAVLAFKSLTRIHPFGGTTNPDMDIIERMTKGLSVIDNPTVTIPRTIRGWNNISPKLLEEWKNIFSNKARMLPANLEDFYNNLKYCDTDADYYYSKFNECPLCNALAKVLEKPIKMESTSGIPIMAYFVNEFVKAILSEDSYIDNNNNVIHIPSKATCKYLKGSKYYFSNDGSIMYAINNKEVSIKFGEKEFYFEKTNKSDVTVIDNKVYYVNTNNNLVELTIDKMGNYAKNIAKVAFNNIISVINDKEYFICNIYDNTRIINISGYNYTVQLKNKDKIVNYGLHFDHVSRRWLFITENQKGKFTTYIFDKNRVVYQSEDIKYTNSLDGMCFYNSVIFKPCDGAIKGFSYEKNVYKDFECSVVNEESKLSRTGNKFVVINEKEIYKVG
jgi:serine/threonine protein kinase